MATFGEEQPKKGYKFQDRLLNNTIQAFKYEHTFLHFQLLL